VTRCWRCEASLNHPGMQAWSHICTWDEAIPYVSVCPNCMIYDWLELECDLWLGKTNWYEDVRWRKLWFTRQCKHYGIAKPDWKARPDLVALADQIWSAWQSRPDVRRLSRQEIGEGVAG
jgi:hypothetical protein